MIIMSKRVFLNVFTQLTPKDVLLNANYYIADLAGPDGINSNIETTQQWSDDGTKLVNTPVNIPIKAFSEFNIKYIKRLDPSIFETELMLGIKRADQYMSPDIQYKNHLMKTETLLEIYDKIFSKEVGGNKLQIIIFFEETSLWSFADIIGPYLANVFGEDIIIYDKFFTEKCRGEKQYKGDKQRAHQIICKLRDMKLLIDFNQYVTVTGAYSTMSNLTVWLETFDFDKLLYIYHLVFPRAQLPAGNYTKEDLISIIANQTAESIDTIIPQLDNISLIPFSEMVGKYGSSDFSDGDFGL